MTDNNDKEIEALTTEIDDLYNSFPNNDARLRFLKISRAIAKLIKIGKDFVPEIREGEPFFILVARDGVFTPLVDAWAYLRVGHVMMAQRALEGVMSAAKRMPPQSNDDPQILSAFRIAAEGKRYELQQSLKPNPKVEAPHVLTESRD